MAQRRRRPRAVTESVPGGIRITVPTPKHWPMVLFLPLWLLGWGVGEVITAAELLRGGPAGTPGRPGPSAAFLLVWLLFWTIGGVLAAAAFLWNALGRETIEVSHGVLRIRQAALGIGRTREIPASRIRALRVAAAPYKPMSLGASLRPWGFGNGVVAIDDGARTIRVLSGVDEAEAESIVIALRERLGLA